MPQLDTLEIQRNIEEKRLVLGKKFENFLLKKLVILNDFFIRIFSEKSFILLSSIAVIALSIFIRSTRDIGYDSAIYLDVAQKILKGGKYYQDFFESTLPLSFYLTTIPLILAKLFSASPIIFLEIFVNLIGIFALYFSVKILKRSEISRDQTVFNLIIFGFCIGFFLRMFTLHSNEFATQTTYFLAFAFPYLSYQFLKEDQFRKSDQILCGTLAALLFCLKPHYGLWAMAFEVKKLFEKKSFKSFFCLRNFVTFSGIIFYTLLLLICFPDYISVVSDSVTIYFQPEYFDIISPLREDIYPLILLIILCFFLHKKFTFLHQFFFSSLVFSLILILELQGSYDQRTAIYAISLPLIFLTILSLIRDQKINWRRDFLVLLLILMVPQFDGGFFEIILINFCVFWWVFVLFLSPKWRKIKASHSNFLSYIFIPRDILSWLCFAALAVITIYLAANRIFNDLAWIYSSIIFVILIGFYQNLQRKFITKNHLSLLPICVIFLVISYFVHLQLSSIFKDHLDQSPNIASDEIIKAVKNNLAADEDFVVISTRAGTAYPAITYVNKINNLPFSELAMLYVKIDNHESPTKFQELLLARLKQEIQNPKNKLIIVKIADAISTDRCYINFLEYYLNDAEFKKIFLKNYRFLNRIIDAKKAERSVKFFDDHSFESLEIKADSVITRDIEIYVRTND